MSLPPVAFVIFGKKGEVAQLPNAAATLDVLYGTVTFVAVYVKE